MRSYKKWLLILLPCVLAIGVIGAIWLKASAEGAPRLVVQLGHSGSISSAVYSPDGRFIVSGGVEDQVAILWEAATGREIRRFVGHKAPINSVAFSLDNRFILTGSGRFEFEKSEAKDYTARLWDIATGNEVRRFEGHTGRVNSVAFSPDGRAILTGSDDKTARLWETQSGKETRKPLTHDAEVHAVAFSPNGKFALTGSGGFGEKCQDCVARLWDTTTWQIAHRFEGHLQRVGSVAFSPDSRFALTAPITPDSDADMGFEEKPDFLVRQWDVATGESLRHYKGFGPASFSPDSRLVITAGAGSQNEGAQVWDANTGVSLHYIPGAYNDYNEVIISKGVAQILAFAPNSSSVLIGLDTIKNSGSLGGEWGEKLMHVYDVKSWQIQRSLNRGTNNLLGETIGGVISIAGQTILAGERFWDTNNGSVLQFEGVNKTSGVGRVQVLSKDGSLALMDIFSPEKPGVQTNLWDTRTGNKISYFEAAAQAAKISSDNKYVLFEEIGFNGVDVSLYEAKTGVLKWKYNLHIEITRHNSWNVPQNHTYSTLSPSGRLVFALIPDSDPLDLIDSRTGKAINNELLVIEVETGNVIRRVRTPKLDRSTSIVISPNGRYVAFENIDSTISFFDVDAGKLLHQIKGKSEESSRVVFSPNSKFIAKSYWPSEKDSHGGVEIWDTATGTLLHQVSVSETPRDFAFSPDGIYLLTTTENLGTEEKSNLARLWEVTSGKEVHKFEHYSAVNAIAFSPDGRFAFTESSDGTTRIWSIETGQESCSLVSLSNGDWVVTTPDGRFDTNNLENINGLHWVTSDEPLRPLPLEIFMRQYYEPRLLARVLAGEQFKPLPKLSELNRTQPAVKIADIAPDAAGTTQVTVEVANVKSEGKRSFFGSRLESGVFDVRLFRNGQLVGYAPENDGEVKLNAEGKATLKFSNIKLPRTGVEQVEFSAYAFNADRVKSTTDRKTYKLTPKPAPVKGRVYLIRLGVNAAEREGLNLRYAATDARRADDLAARLAARGEYQEVVSLPLISDYTVTLADGRTLAAHDATSEEVRAGRKRVTENTATKAHLRAVLDMLAGRQADAALLKQIPNADKLHAARPEDLVLISASSHGYTDSDGIFYLVPSDSGTADLKSPEFRRRCVSSDELSRWLRDVDAGELVLIVDACHSAAAIEGTDFKPGPMGSRGLGQLSYDKGMRILTATQADNVALEKGGLGLLMRALLVDGLMGWQADYKPRDKSILLTEWLGYSVDRVPRLYEEMKDGRIRGTFDPRELADSKTQQPALFDFARRRRDVVLARQP